MKLTTPIAALYPAAETRADKPSDKVPYIIVANEVFEAPYDATPTEYRDAVTWEASLRFTPKQRKAFEKESSKMQAEMLRIAPEGAIDAAGQIDMAALPDLIDDGSLERIQDISEQLERRTIEFYCGMPVGHMSSLDEVIGGDAILRDFVPAAMAAINELNASPKSK